MTWHNALSFVLYCMFLYEYSHKIRIKTTHSIFMWLIARISCLFGLFFSVFFSPDLQLHDDFYFCSLQVEIMSRGRSFCLSLSLSLVSIYLSLPLPPSPSLSLFISQSLFISLSLSFSVSIPPSHYPPITLPISPHSFSLTPSLFPSYN